MDKEFIKKIKAKLEKEEKRLKKELGGFTKKSVHAKGDYHAKFPNFGSESDENAKEVAVFGNRLTLERTLEKELRDVKSTLKKIKGKAYGVCKYCKKEISKARLLARPTSSACVQCKKSFKGEK